MNLSELKRRISFARTQDERAQLLQLAEIGPAQLTVAFRIWERHAPPKLRGILTGNGWHWDSTIQGYRSADGKVVSGAKLKDLALQVSDAVKKDMRKKSHGIGLIPLFVWKHQFALECAGLFTLMAMLGAGGAHNLTPKIKKAVVGFSKTPGGLAFSLDRLSQWGRQLREDEKEKQEDELYEPGGMKSEDRAELYGDAGAAILETVRAVSHDDARDDKGRKLFAYYRNILDPTCSDHCRDAEWTDGCPSVTRAGWQKIGDLPAIGTRTCAARDRCSWRFSRTGSDDEPSEN